MAAVNPQQKQLYRQQSQSYFGGKRRILDWLFLLQLIMPNTKRDISSLKHPFLRLASRRLPSQQRPDPDCTVSCGLIGLLTFGTIHLDLLRLKEVNVDMETTKSVGSFFADIPMILY